MDINCLALPKHRKNLFSVYQIIEHDFFAVKKYLEVHLIRTNFELVTCGVLALKEKINLQSIKVNTTAVDKNDLVLDQCGNVTLSMRKVVRRRTASFSTTGPSSFRPITSNCLRGGTERIRKLNQNLWPTNYMSNDSTNNNN